VTATGTINPGQSRSAAGCRGESKSCSSTQQREVKKGMVLATLDTRLFDSAVAQAKPAGVGARGSAGPGGRRNARQQ
jgi:hypothetical protein